jgi:hypothetical protein
MCRLGPGQQGCGPTVHHTAMRACKRSRSWSQWAAAGGLQRAPGFDTLLPPPPAALRQPLRCLRLSTVFLWPSGGISSVRAARQGRPDAI